jgi:hypothetical protein
VGVRKATDAESDRPAVLAATAGPSRRSPLHRFLAWHPEWWVYAVAATAWVVLLWMGVRMMTSMPMAGPMDAGHTSSWTDRWIHWLLMIAAMMLLVSARRVRLVAQRGAWSRRQRSAGSFVLGYLVLWAVVGAALVTIVVGTGLDHDATDLLVVSLLLAAAWQTSVPRRRIVRRGEPLEIGAPSGWAADVACVRAGVSSGVRCLQECWPAMIAMALSQSLVLMTGLTVVLLTERTRSANPQQRGGRPLEAWLLAGFALFAALLTVT